MRILVLGSLGLIGKALTKKLIEDNHEVVGYDIGIQPGLPEHGDIRDALRLEKAAQGCDGIVHLAAVSRVVWGENDPDLCKRINVDGTKNVLTVAQSMSHQPWVLFSSSREVYGKQRNFPVAESAPLEPINVYGWSKFYAEQLIMEASESGLRASIMRLSNVFGSVDDHLDRVVPAFARGGALGEPLRVDGFNNSFDFTPLTDTIEGIKRLIELLDSEGSQAPIHFLTGRETTLLELAEMAVRIGGKGSQIVPGPTRDYDVSRFVGDPTNARDLLGWSSTTTLETSLEQLIDAFGGSSHGRW